MKNSKNLSNYLFNFVDEKGHTCGFNDVWASNIEEAYALACETFNKEPYQHAEFGHIPGMFVDKSSLVLATQEMADAQNRMGWMLTM
jgi:hypothetical protein